LAIMPSSLSLHEMWQRRSRCSESRECELCWQLFDTPPPSPHRRRPSAFRPPLLNSRYEASPRRQARPGRLVSYGAALENSETRRADIAGAYLHRGYRRPPVAVDEGRCFPYAAEMRGSTNCRSESAGRTMRPGRRSAPQGKIARRGRYPSGAPQPLGNQPS
jgi:hypothetical protein